MPQTREINIILKATDDASRVLENAATKSLPEFAKRIANVGAAFLSINAGVDILEESFKAAMDAEKSTAALTQAFKTQGLSVIENIPHLTAYALSLSRISLADHTAIEGAQKLLVSVGGLRGEGLDRATKAALDLSSALGMDLNSAAEAIAKAANGSVREFTRLGVKFQQNATDAEKLNTVLDFIDRRFGGAAQAQVETMAGKVDQLTKSWRELEEAIGNAALKSAPGGPEGLTAGLRAVTEMLNNEGIGKTLDRIGAAALGNPKAIAALQGMIDFLKMQGTIDASLANKFTKAIDEADPVVAKFTKTIDDEIKAQKDAAEWAKKHAEEIAKLRDKMEANIQPRVPVRSIPGSQAIGGDLDKSIIRGLVDQDKAQEDAAKSANALTDAFILMSKPVDSLEQAWERVNSIMQVISDATPDMRAKLIAMGNSAIEAGKQAESLGRQIETTLKHQAGSSILELGNLMVEAAFGAKVAWGDALKSIAEDFVKVIVKALIVRTLESVIGGGFFSGGGVASGGGGSFFSAGEFFSQGGMVPAYASSGLFLPRGTDTVPAMLTPGEGILKARDTHEVLGGRAKIVPIQGDADRPIELTVNLGGAHLTTLLIRNRDSIVEAMEYISARRF